MLKLFAYKLQQPAPQAGAHVTHLEHVSYIANKGAWDGVGTDPMSFPVLDLHNTYAFSLPCLPQHPCRQGSQAKHVAVPATVSMSTGKPSKTRAVPAMGSVSTGKPSTACCCACHCTMCQEESRVFCWHNSCTSCCCAYSETSDSCLSRSKFRHILSTTADGFGVYHIPSSRRIHTYSHTD